MNDLIEVSLTKGENMRNNNMFINPEETPLLKFET